ncbi:ankyrin repeat-containing domain protein, partial [Lasiosphaeria ovina]
LLNEFPCLADLVGEYGRRPLHSAATQGWLGYVEELLRRGASPYDRSNDRSTPFSWSLMRNPNLEVVEIPINHCDNMGPILGPDEQSGFTTSGKVLGGLINHRMNFDLDRLRYLVDRFGHPSFFCRMEVTYHAHSTVLRAVLVHHTSCLDKGQLALEISVLEFLLDVFPDKVDFVDFSGRPPLHYAAWYGHFLAVELLLRRDAGYTALDLAVKSQRIGPGKNILRGGRREIEAWEANMRNIIRVLIDDRSRNVEPGSGVPLPGRVLLETVAGNLRNVHVGGGMTLRSDRGGDGDWPEVLPHEGPAPASFGVPRSSGEENETIEII